MHGSPLPLFFFFFNDTATTEIYTLSLHDALPISELIAAKLKMAMWSTLAAWLLVLVALPLALEWSGTWSMVTERRSEEHTSELQSQSNLVCRLLLEKKKKQLITICRVVDLV